MEWEENAAYDQAIGLMFTKSGAALKAFDQAIARQPERWRIHANRAWVLHLLGRDDEALAAARHAFERDPSDGYLGMRFGHILFEKKRYAEFLPVSAAALACANLEDHDRRWLTVGRAWALMLDDPERAAVESHAALEHWPDDGELLAAHACALAAGFEWDAALAFIDEAIAASPGDPRFVARRATFVDGKQLADDQMAAARDAAENSPEEARAWRELGLLYAKFARREAALEAFDRANKIDPFEAGAEEVDPLTAQALMVEATLRTDQVVGITGRL